MDDKLLKIALVLGSLPEDVRLALARQLLSRDYAVVPRRSSVPIEHAFKSTAIRFHAGLRTELKFNPTAIGPCWRAMVEEAATRGSEAGAETAA